jgi:hypothetical protein
MELSVAPSHPIDDTALHAAHHPSERTIKDCLGGAWARGRQMHCKQLLALHAPWKQPGSPSGWCRGRASPTAAGEF